VLPYALHVCDALVSLLVHLTLDPPSHDHSDLPCALCSLSQRAQGAKSFSSPSTMVTKYGRGSLRKTSVQQPPTLPLLEEFLETESPCTWCVAPPPLPPPPFSPPPCQMLSMPRGLQKRLIVALPSHDSLFSGLLARCFSLFPSEWCVHNGGARDKGGSAHARRSAPLHQLRKEGERATFHDVSPLSIQSSAYAELSLF
jgi:hypothetical protein